MKESSTDDRWRESPRSRSLLPPVDALGVVGFVLLANGALFTSVAQGPAIRGLVGLPLLFLIPGYALVSTLFPGRGRSNVGRREERVVGGDVDQSMPPSPAVEWRKRLALSFGTSVGLQPLFAVALSLLGLEYTLEVLLMALSGFAVLFMAVAVVRRSLLPPDQRFRVPYDRWIAGVNHGLFVESSKVDVALNVGLAVVVVASLAGVGYAVTVPNNAETFTSATLLTENGQGELVASGYPDALDESGSQFVLRLENHEGEAVSYTVVSELQRVQSTDGAQQVGQRQEVLRTSTTIDDGASWTHPHTVEPSVAGDDLRLIYYVYRGEAPPNPSIESAHRYVHVWVDVPSSATG